jgi:type II secretory pathway component GspD/PulD (secretin)
LGETGRLYVGVDGLIVVGDRANVLARVDEMCDGIVDAPAVTWCVQLYLVSINEQNLADLGLDAKPALEVAYTFSAASAGLGRVGSPLGGRAELEGGLAAVLRAARESKGVHLLAEPLFVLVDGGSATFKNGETIPIVRRTENPQSGNVTTTGFDVFDTGLSVTCSVREMGQSAARCQVKVENSQIVDIVDGVPRTTREGLDSDVVMVSGGVYLVGSLHRQRREERQSGWLSLGRYTKESTDLVQVWARAYRVSEDILP